MCFQRSRPPQGLGACSATQGGSSSSWASAGVLECAFSGVTLPVLGIQHLAPLPLLGSPGSFLHTVFPAFRLCLKVQSEIENPYLE